MREHENEGRTGKEEPPWEGGMPLREELSLRERCFHDGCAIEGGGVVKGRKGAIEGGGVIMVSVPSKKEVSSREGRVSSW